MELECFGLRSQPPCETGLGFGVSGLQRERDPGAPFSVVVPGARAVRLEPQLEQGGSQQLLAVQVLPSRCHGLAIRQRRPPALCKQSLLLSANESIC